MVLRGAMLGRTPPPWPTAPRCCARALGLVSCLFSGGAATAGYALESPDSLVLLETHFGDFANDAKVL